MKIYNFDNSFFIFFLCFFSIVTNVISSIYFFAIFLLGPLFLAFCYCLKNKRAYSLFLIILTIFLIELNNGFMPFSIIALSLFIYTFIIPYFKKVLSIENIKIHIYITILYLGLYILWISNNENSTELEYALLVNLLIDYLNILIARLFLGLLFYE